MSLLRQEIKERPTAERALRSLGEAVGLSRSTIGRQLRSPVATPPKKDTERRVEIHRCPGNAHMAIGYHRRLLAGEQIINHKVVLRLA
jgi:hypothetical protein